VVGLAYRLTDNAIPFEIRQTITGSKIEIAVCVLETTAVELAAFYWAIPIKSLSANA
jgi:hypothetical protein